MFLLKDTPIIYYGQELGMRGATDAGYPTDEQHIPVREAFKWSATDAAPGQALWYKRPGERYWDQRYARDHDGVLVEEEDGKPGSLLNHYRALAKLRGAGPHCAHLCSAAPVADRALPLAQIAAAEITRGNAEALPKGGGGLGRMLAAGQFLEQQPSQREHVARPSRPGAAESATSQSNPAASRARASEPGTQACGCARRAASSAGSQCTSTHSVAPASSRKACVVMAGRNSKVPSVTGKVPHSVVTEPFARVNQISSAGSWKCGKGSGACASAGRTTRSTRTEFAGSSAIGSQRVPVSMRQG
jgi:hypothetical protein